MFPKRRSILVPLFLVLNSVVYAMWLFTTTEESAAFMADHFLVSFDALAAGRYWTLLTSAFSHNMLLHFFINMFVLQSFGTLIEQVIGRRSFLVFYVLAAILSSLSHALVSALILGAPELPALGASGAIAGLVLIFALLFPKQPILIFGIIPMPAMVGAIAFIGLDLWGLYAQAGGGGLPIGHGAHLGGAFTGILYYFLYLRPRLYVRQNFWR